MFGFGGRAAPARVATDCVVPVGFFDNTIIFRTLVLYTLFAFDDVLDPYRLRTSLARVVAQPGWNKLGARVRRNTSGDLDHHIFLSYSEERPAIGYDHLDLGDGNLEDHPAASHIPKPSHDSHSTVVSDPDKLVDLYSSPGIPKGLDDYIYSDRPELGLRVVSFKNKTIVVLHWIHRMLLQRPVKRMYLSSPRATCCWPGRVIQAMTASLSRDSETTIAVQQAYQFRPVLKDLNPVGRPFLSNCVSFLVSLMPAKDVTLKPLSHLASSIRHLIKEQGIREQVEAYTSLVREDPANHAPPFFGESGMQLIMFSNWSKSNLFATDLSAAAAKSRSEPLCSSYLQSVQGPCNFNDGIIVVGKDMQGNHWLSGYRAWGLWGLMEEEIARQRTQLMV
ncbi:AAA ATPase [Emericellopsis cladophorae]|uniref:AAA ATPase n=1 Tax=Emericellopsis cladophorae TaxID=2686198 RepID=A0A9P9XV22_9HYPO|nr:AAA ATPase [Emericellopsis cladophorae]KAI6778163.1 AAA ATPase [Emericellopsis cladophorae]